jgi:hypothetical protein
MKDDNWYFRNRSRDAIVDMFRVVRQLQQLNGFKDSEVMRAMASVWKESEVTQGESTLVSVHFYYIIREMEHDENYRR